MTLLSIREQEAVQEALDDYEALRCGRCPRDGRCRECRALLLEVVILATRDAIARQVRERANGADWSLESNAKHYAGWNGAATFIEEMRCE